MAIFVWGRESLSWRPPGYTGVGSTSEHDNIVRGVFCVFLGSTEAALIGNFTPARKICHENRLGPQWRASRATLYPGRSWHILRASVKLAY